MLKLLLAAAILAPSLALVESRRREKTEIDRAIRNGVTALKARPATLNSDNSNSSYGVLEHQPRIPAWRWNPARRLRGAAGLIQGLKDRCWKGIVSASYSK